MRASQLKPYGLSETEAKTYLAALELGEASVERIAKKAELNRSSIYHTLNILKEKGLVTTAKRTNKTVYVAEDPRKMKQNMEDQLQAFDILLPELRSLANVIDRKPKIKFHEGYQGLIEVAKNMLSEKTREVQFWFPDLKQEKEEYKTFWNEYFEPKRVGLGITAKAIGPECEYGRFLVSGDKKVLRQTRLDDSETFNPTSVVEVYGDRWTTVLSHKDMIAIEIESKEINLTMRSIFESHWAALDPRK